MNKFVLVLCTLFIVAITVIVGGWSIFLLTFWNGVNDIATIMILLYIALYLFTLSVIIIPIIFKRRLKNQKNISLIANILWSILILIIYMLDIGVPVGVLLLIIPIFIISGFLIEKKL